VLCSNTRVPMYAVELVLALLVVVVALRALAPALRLPYPILLVIGGLVLALVPAVPDVVLAPDLVFLLFLPPLLYAAAYDTSIRDIRANLRPILSLAVGLVLATTGAVAVVVHAVLPALGWPIAFALGAIVSPPDAVAAVAVFRGLGVPRRLVTIVEGESLFNDATALVIYQAALAAAVTATFSVGEATLRFLVVGAGGVLVGLGVGLAVAQLRRRLHDPGLDIAVSLLTPFAAWLPAEQLGVSGVLATVTTGLVIGWWAPDLTAPDTRLRGHAVWEMVTFLLNGLVFILIGLQLLRTLPALAARPVASLVGLGLLISVVVILLRFVWLFAGRAVERRGGAGQSQPSWRETVVVGWAGMRGVVSLATALALPLETPERDLLIFLTFCVILVTLVGQGLSLPWLVHVLGVSEDAGVGDQERQARRAAAEAALSRLQGLAAEWPTHLPLIDALRAQYEHRASHLEELTSENDDEDGAAEQELLEHRLIRRAVSDAERAAVLRLRQNGAIDDQAWRRIERDLDLEALRMDA
jgi:monovalent cation/hydrogen antiporter